MINNQVIMKLLSLILSSILAIITHMAYFLFV
jgi:hypothetical protein